MRFRNRFTGETSDIRRCACGLSVSRTVKGARETFLHEEPWCDMFTEVVRIIQRGCEGVRLEAGQIVASGELEILGQGKTEAEVREIAARAVRERQS